MMLDGMQILSGLLLSSLIGGLAYWRGSLTLSGWLGAVLTGTATFGFGGWSWGLLLVTFFITSSLLSHYKEEIKLARAGEKFEKGGKRDFWQTMANGGIAALIALLYPLLVQAEWLWYAYIGVMATVTADTWATELGTLSDAQPRLITSFRPVETGTSGGITAFGTFAAALGGLCIGLAALLFSTIGSGFSAALLLLPLVGLVGGLAGALFDSLLGATLQSLYRNPQQTLTERSHDSTGHANQRVQGLSWMNNDAVNLLSSLVGGLVACLFSLL
jgi:uncharacterized protein (TIGR00297 family)